MSQTASTPFHLAFAVTDIAETEAFFVSLLGCKVGRRAERWIDFDFSVTSYQHLVDGDLSAAETNPVDGQKVPSRHFGAILNGKPAVRFVLISSNRRIFHSLMNLISASRVKWVSKRPCFSMIPLAMP